MGKKTNAIDIARKENKRLNRMNVKKKDSGCCPTDYGFSYGVGAPSGTSNEGSWYLDTSSGDWYQYSTGSWTILYTNTGGGGGGSIPNPMTADVNIDMDGNTLQFDGRTTPGGRVLMIGEMASGFDTTFYHNEENIFGIGLKGSGLSVIDSGGGTGTVSMIGDFTSIGLTPNDTGAVFGTLDFSSNKGSGILKTSSDRTTGDTLMIMSSTTSGTATGNNEIQIAAQALGAASGESLITVQSIGQAASNLLLYSTGVTTSVPSAVRVKAFNTTDSEGIELYLNSEEGFAIRDNSGTALLNFTEAFNGAQYADDTAASGGGVAVGDAYVRTTGLIAIRLV